MSSKTPQGLQIRRETNMPTAEELARAYPDVEPGYRPYGTRVCVQLRSPSVVSPGGIQYPTEVIEVEMWNAQDAMVRILGPVAFKDRKTLESWPEGDWCKPGAYVRIPKYNQDKWFIKYDSTFKSIAGEVLPCKEYVLFMLVNDLDLLAEKTGNPLEVKAYV